MKLNELYEIYVNDVELEKKRTTLDSISYRYKNRLKDRFGDLELKDITLDMIKDYQKEMLYEEKLSADYINRVIGILKQILDCGVIKGYVAINPLSNIKKVRDQYNVKKEPVVWELETFKVFESCIDDDIDRLLFNLLYFLGLRKGELLALKWNQVDFEKKSIHIISTAVQIVGKGQVITTPKTTHSIREIIMNDSMFDLLSEYYFKVKMQYEVTSHLFVIGSEKMISFSALDRKLSKYLKKSGVEKITLHGFRHSHATMLSRLTTDIKSISERLGHESIDVTINTYIHSNSSAQRQLASLLENEVVQAEDSMSFADFTNYLEKMLLKEVTGVNKQYKEAEIKGIISIYNFVRNKEYLC